MRKDVDDKENFGNIEIYLCKLQNYVKSTIDILII